MALLDAREFGWGSRAWILKHAILHAPQENKDRTLTTLVEVLSHEGETTARQLLDIIAQGVLTGIYYPTAYPAPEQFEDDGLYPENDNPENSLRPFTEEEIERFSRRLDEVLGDTTTGDAAPDPFEGWTIDE